MAQWKVKTLEATKFSEMLIAKIILKLKYWAQKFCNLESQIFWLHSHWSKSHWLESDDYIWFGKHHINTWFSWCLCDRKNIDIASIFSIYNFSRNHFNNIYLRDSKLPSTPPLLTITWFIRRKFETKQYITPCKKKTQSGTKFTSWPWFRSGFVRFLFVEFIWLIRQRIL